MKDAAWPGCYLCWNQPLQSCWIRQASVYISLTVALLCVAQVEAVCCKDILVGEKHKGRRHTIETESPSKMC